jgi:hypothetical protein
MELEDWEWGRSLAVLWDIVPGTRILDMVQDYMPRAVLVVVVVGAWDIALALPRIWHR